MRQRFVAAAVMALMTTAELSAQRTPDGHPDLQGVWTNETLTPLTRPADLAGQAHFTPAQAKEYERTALERLLKSIPDDEDTGKAIAADLNDTYLDTAHMKVLDDLRTSLVVDPPDGKMPAPLPAAGARALKRPKRSYDDPEGVSLDERCLLATAFGTSNASPPMIPNPFAQNLYQIVQTPTYVMIFTETVHDARIVRINGTHAPMSMQFWLGDSIGRWEGDTLVVDTTNFTDKTHFRGSGTQLHVVERFSRANANTISYRATIEDPDTWATPWTVDIPFKTSTEQMFEYACHEGNYAIENFMRGARAQEKEKVQ